MLIYSVLVWFGLWFLATGVLADYGVCPNAVTVTKIVPAPLTTISHCPTCPVIVVTSSAQPITSCNGATKSSTTSVCTETGVVTCGGAPYTCNQPPCTIRYQAPCSTCYVCPYNECYAPESPTSVSKHVKCYEYFDDKCIDIWDEQWQYDISAECITKTSWVETHYISEGITVHLSQATTLTLTETSTATVTSIVSTHKHHSHSFVPHSSLLPPLSASATVSASPSGTPNAFRLQIGSLGPYYGFYIDEEGAVLSWQTTNTGPYFTLVGSQLYDNSSTPIYLSSDSLASEGRSLAIATASPPEDALLNIFSLDGDALIVTVPSDTPIANVKRDGQVLVCMACSDGFLYFGKDTPDTCSTISLISRSSGPSPSNSVNSFVSSATSLTGLVPSSFVPPPPPTLSPPASSSGGAPPPPPPPASSQESRYVPYSFRSYYNSSMQNYGSATPSPSISSPSSVSVVIASSSAPVVLPSSSVPVVLPSSSVPVVLPSSSVPVVLPSSSVPVVLPSSSVPVVVVSASSAPLSASFSTPASSIYISEFSSVASQTPSSAYSSAPAQTNFVYSAVPSDGALTAGGYDEPGTTGEMDFSVTLGGEGISGVQIALVADGGLLYYDYGGPNQLIGDVMSLLTDANGSLIVYFASPDVGTYQVRVTTSDSSAPSLIIFDWYVNPPQVTSIIVTNLDMSNELPQGSIGSMLVTANQPSARIYFEAQSDDMCSFTDDNGDPVSSMLTDSNGTFTVNVQCGKVGPDTVTFSPEYGSASAEFTWDIIQEPDCGYITYEWNINGANVPVQTTGVPTFIVGEDVILVQAVVLDQSASPIANYNVSFLQDGSADPIIIQTDISGIANINTADFPELGGGPDYWNVTVGNCPTQQLNLNWQYFPECGLSQIVQPVSGGAYPITSLVPIRVQFAAASGSSLVGAQAAITGFGGGTAYCNLDADDVCSTTISWAGTVPPPDTTITADLVITLLNVDEGETGGPCALGITIFFAG